MTNGDEQIPVPKRPGEYEGPAPPGPSLLALTVFTCRGNNKLLNAERPRSEGDSCSDDGWRKGEITAVWERERCAHAGEGLRGNSKGEKRQNERLRREGGQWAGQAARSTVCGL